MPSRYQSFYASDRARVKSYFFVTYLFNAPSRVQHNTGLRKNVYNIGF